MLAGATNVVLMDCQNASQSIDSTSRLRHKNARQGTSEGDLFDPHRKASHDGIQQEPFHLWQSPEDLAPDVGPGAEKS